MTEKTTNPLEEKIEILSRRLEEAENALSAIRDGEIDALLINAQKEQVFTLESPERPYQLLADALPCAAATLTEDGRVVHANGAFVALTGRPLSSLRERRLHEVVSEASHARLERMLGDGLLSDVDGELVFERGDGTQVSREFTVRCWYEGVLGRCLVLADVTVERRYEGLRRTQDELRQAVKRLSQADRRKDEFLAVLSHELRN
ncbi:MAG TPA: PAS domain-containing protein, partial [Candidatus Eisenbacteria bacterium]|nr:PAS domain-containing protein [Candidatus Eisenbacteria bacterium]